jgi:hypothetical protein
MFVSAKPDVVEQDRQLPTAVRRGISAYSHFGRNALDSRFPVKPILCWFVCAEAAMIRKSIEVGAFTWAKIRRLYDADAVVHWQRCESEGLQCPQEVFTQLFFEEANNEDFSVIVRSIDWGRVSWELQELSGVALRHMRVDRGYQHALDEARDRATQFGIVDDREEVVKHWKDAKSWVVPPVVVSGDLLGGGAGFELLVGYTRLGNLLGMLDREEVAEANRLLVWVGRGIS